MDTTCKNCMLWAKIPGTHEGECRMGPPTPVMIGRQRTAPALMGMPSSGGEQPVFAFVVPRTPGQYGCACFRPKEAPQTE